MNQQIKRSKMSIDDKLSEAFLQGTKEDANIRHEKAEKIAEDHKYDYWWLGGNKFRKFKKTNNYKKQKTKRKTRKSRKIRKTRKARKNQ
jgi:hypothetical protein